MAERGRGVSFPAQHADEPVITGHDEGIITLNIAEADSAFRENMREKMGEAYRTVLGHLRHEIGHYYWDRLIRNSNALQALPPAVRRRHVRLRPGRAAPLRAGCRPRTGRIRTSAPTPPCIRGKTGPRPGRTTCTWSTRSRPPRATALRLRVPAPSVRRADFDRRRWRFAISNR